MVMGCFPGRSFVRVFVCSIRHRYPWRLLKLFNLHSRPRVLREKKGLAGLWILTACNSISRTYGAVGLKLKSVAWTYSARSPERGSCRKAYVVSVKNVRIILTSFLVSFFNRKSTNASRLEVTGIGHEAPGGALLHRFAPHRGCSIWVIENFISPRLP